MRMFKTSRPAPSPGKLRELSPTDTEAELYFSLGIAALIGLPFTPHRSRAVDAALVAILTLKGEEGIASWN